MSVLTDFDLWDNTRWCVWLGDGHLTFFPFGWPLLFFILFPYNIIFFSQLQHVWNFCGSFLYFLIVNVHLTRKTVKQCVSSNLHLFLSLSCVMFLLIPGKAGFLLYSFIYIFFSTVKPLKQSCLANKSG